MGLPVKLIQLRMREYDPPKNGNLLAEPVDVVTNEPPVPGDLYEEPDMGEQGDEAHWGHFVLSDAYWTLPAPRRAPLCVVLPEGTHFYLDSRQFTDGTPHEPGWAVSGTPPRMTCAPSINVVGRWHGYLENGELRPA